jgi:molybdopterin synthase catalytic subunit
METIDTHIEFTPEAIVEPAGEGTGRETGAEVEFRGIVREMEKGKAIGGLNYEAHVPMATRQIERIVEQINGTWPCQEVWFVHRLGWVPVGEASLYIRVRASHREEAFRFCMELIDLLKKDVAIFKMAKIEGPGS